MLVRARDKHIFEFTERAMCKLKMYLLMGLAMLGSLHIVKQLGIRITRFFKRSVDESLFLYQVGLQSYFPTTHLPKSGLVTTVNTRLF